MITFRRLGRLGRFGNRLFQYSATRLYSEINGFEFGFPRWEGVMIFRLANKRLTLMSCLLPTIQLDDLSATSWAERILSPIGLWKRDSMEHLWKHPRNNINLYGYMQDPATLAMLRGHADIIREWFTLNQEIESTMRTAVGTHTNWVAVHIRRGDMVKRNAATNVDETRGIIRRLAAGRPVYIASDDATIVEAFSEFSPLILTDISATIPAWLVDFWMLRNSSLLIGSGSTFAWWAAFLGGMEYWAQPLNHTWNGKIPPRSLQSP